MMMRRTCTALGALLLLGGAPAAKPTDLTCLTPIGPTDSAASLVKRYGSNARIETYGGSAGESWRVLILFPDNPKRRLEVSFWDDQPGQKMTQVSRVMAISPAHWRIAGVKLGDDWQKIAEANALPFRFQGFGNRNGGGVVDSLNGGKLASWPGGCQPFFWLTRPKGGSVPSRLMEPTALMSNDPALQGQRVKIHAMGFAVPKPQ